MADFGAEYRPPSSQRADPGSQPIRWIGFALLGGVVAGALVIPVLCMAGLIIPATSHQAVEGIDYVLWVVACVAAPLAACIGALASAVAARFALWRNPQAQPARLAAMVGAVAGLGGGAAGAFILFDILCRQGAICLRLGFTV